MQGNISKDIIWIWLSQLGRPVNKILTYLLKEYGSVENIWRIDSRSSLTEELVKNKELGNKLLDSQRRENAFYTYEKAIKDGGKITHLGKKNYPELLREIYSPPVVLYYYGVLPFERNPDMPLLSVVGARKCTTYGKSIVYKLCAQLAYCGIGIVSGLAKGIDARAHEGAIAGDGYTIGVLGGGADVIYPFENIHLYYKVREYGCVMSEYPPGTAPQRNHFPARNRIIAGLSQGTFVCEAAKSSGSMITVDRALEENRQIYALPGNVDSELSEGTNNLIKKCAVCVTSYEDILLDLGFEPKRRPSTESVMKLQGLEGNVKVIGELIADGAMSVDEIQKLSGLSSSSVQVALTILEVKGIIRRNNRGGFSII